MKHVYVFYKEATNDDCIIIANDKTEAIEYIEHYYGFSVTPDQGWSCEEDTYGRICKCT